MFRINHFIFFFFSIKYKEKLNAFGSYMNINIAIISEKNAHTLLETWICKVKNVHKKIYSLFFQKYMDSAFFRLEIFWKTYESAEAKKERQRFTLLI